MITKEGKEPQNHYFSTYNILNAFNRDILFQQIIVIFNYIITI